jgi:hypothetical protein
MASEGGKGNFGATGGYGGNFNAGGGGLHNISGSAGGNPMNWSGGVSDYGASAAAASRVGQPATSMNAAANQAMASAGYVLNNNGVWAAPRQPMYNKSGEMTFDPNQKSKILVRDPITGKLVPYVPGQLPTSIPTPPIMPPQVRSCISW